MCLSGTLAEKMRAAADAGFDGIEIFEQDLVVSPHTPAQIRQPAAELGLSLDLYQPFRDLDGVEEDVFRDGLRRLEAKLGVARELGIDTMLLCSNVGTATIDDDEVCAEAAGEFAHRLDHFVFAHVLRADRVRCAERLGCRIALSLIDVYSNHRGRTRKRRTSHGSQTDAAEAEDHDGLAALDVTGVHGGAEAGHDAAAEQAGRGRVGLRVHLRALLFVHEGLLRERADAQGRGELGAVGKRHALGGVVGVEAVLRVALAAGAALAAHCAPVQHHEIAFGDVGDVLADRLDDTSRLMAEQERERIFDVAVAVRQVRVAHAGGLDLDHNVVGAGLGDHNVHDLDRGALLAGDYSLHSLCHVYKSTSARKHPPRYGVAMAFSRPTHRPLFLMRSFARFARAVTRSGMVSGEGGPRAALAVAPSLARYWFTTAREVEQGAAAVPDRIALIDDTGVLTYRQLRDDSRRLAQWLLTVKDERGLDELRIGVMARNGRGIILPLAAKGYAGAHIFLLNIGSSTEQLAGIFAENDIDVLFVDDEFADRVPATPGLAVVRAHENGGAGLSIREVVGRRDVDRQLPRWPKHGNLVLMSSGTTGIPKGIVRPEPRLPFVVAGYLEAIPWRAGDTVQLTASIFHTWGWSALQVALATRSTIVTQRIFDAEACFTQIEKYRCDGLISSPIFFKQMLDIDESYDTSSLRYLASAGNAVTPSLLRRTTERFGPILANIYGSTELALAAAAFICSRSATSPCTAIASTPSSRSCSTVSCAASAPERTRSRSSTRSRNVRSVARAASQATINVTKYSRSRRSITPLLMESKRIRKLSEATASISHCGAQASASSTIGKPLTMNRKQALTARMKAITWFFARADMHEPMARYEPASSQLPM